MITTKDHKDDIISQRALTYTPDGQIKSIKDNDKLIATYQYNHLRQRISKTIYQKDNQANQTKEETTQYLWDKGLLSAEIKDDKVIRRYVYLDIMPVAFLDYGYDEKGKLNETKVYSVHTDHLGTPKAISDKDKNIVWQAELDTFGETKQIQAKTITDPNTNTQRPFEFNLRFAGQYFDQESGYHYNYHRYYDPKVGRYLTSDPIGLNGGSLNTYAYVDNESWGLVDPSGLLSYNPYTRNFTIDKGDTLQSIGKEFGISDVDLTKLNPQFFANPKDITKFKQDTVTDFAKSLGKVGEAIGADNPTDAEKQAIDANFQLLLQAHEQTFANSQTNPSVPATFFLDKRTGEPRLIYGISIPEIRKTILGE